MVRFLSGYILSYFLGRTVTEESYPVYQEFELCLTPLVDS